MIFIRLLALGVLAHQCFALCYDGKKYLTNCFLPVLGLNLRPMLKLTLHTLLIAFCFVLLIRPQYWLLYPGVFIMISLIIASYSFRLSNHLIVLWFMALVLCLDVLFQTRFPENPGTFLVAGIQIIVILTYLISFFHKLNSEYLSNETSCAANLARLYLEERRIRNPTFVKILRFWAIYGTLVLEGSIPILLIVPATRPLAICLAVLLHISLGLLCNFHFSSVMYAGLAAFIPREVWSEVLRSGFLLGPFAIAALLLAGALLGWRFGFVELFHHRHAAIIAQIIFGIYSMAAMFAGVVLFLHDSNLTLGWANLGLVQSLVLAIIAALFLLNGLSPYLGIKTEFSLAMFSNLRHEPWRHLLFPSRWRLFNLASYVKVEHIDGLPDARQVDPGTPRTVLIWLLAREEVLYSSYFFHESLQLICQSLKPAPVIRVVYVERGERHEINDYGQHLQEQQGRYLRATLFPYGISIDPSIPYCS